MKDSGTSKGRTTGPAPGRGRDRRRLAGAMGTVDVHGTVPGSGTMRRVGEVFAMRPVAPDCTRYEE
jgi:hypothetical protein